MGRARCLKLSEMYQRRVQATNLSKRSIEEGRRRTKVTGSAPKEEAGLSPVRAVLVDVSRRWRGIKNSPADLEKLAALQAELAPLPVSA